MVWAWNKNAGLISANDAYGAISASSRAPENHWWYKKLWKWSFPLKIKCFSWLCLERKILTYDNLMKKGFSGPNFCILCKSAEENITHLFVDCVFCHDVWAQILEKVRIQFSCTLPSLEGKLLSWSSAHPSYKILPFFVMWGLWRA